MANFLSYCGLPGIESLPKAVFLTTLTDEPNTQMKECYLYMIRKSFPSAQWWTSTSQLGNALPKWWEKEYWVKGEAIFLAVVPNKPKCCFILLQYAIMNFCPNFCDPKLTINKRWRPENFYISAATLRNNFLKQNCYLPIKIIKWLIYNHQSLQEINFAAVILPSSGPTWKQTKQELQNSQFFKQIGSISPVLCSLGSVIRYEANKSNQ